MATTEGLTPASCKATLKTKKHHEYPVALRSITVKVTHPQLGEIADLEALLIDRSELPPGDFMGIMDDEHDDLQKLALGVFDADARIQDRILHDDHHKGTGCWGQELNDGRIAYIYTVRVDEPYRRIGMGTFALETLMNSRYIRKKDFLAAWPFPPPGGDTKVLEHAIAFFHKNHFRRIGRTQFFAYSPNAAHPSRRVVAADDAPDESDFAPPDDTEDSMDVDAFDQTPAETSPLFALHSAIARCAGVPFNPFQPPVPPQPPSVVIQLINAAYGADPSSITRRNEAGITPLHVAAQTLNVAAVRALLALPAASGVQATVTARTYRQGLAPLDLIERQLEMEKAFKLSMDMFSGHDADAIRCTYLLKKAAGVQLWTEKELNNATFKLDKMTEKDREDRFVELRRFECSCSCCIGWLSPRMLFRIASSAAQLFGMTALASIYQPYSDILPPEFFEDNLGLYFIPFSARRKATETWFKGYHALYYLIFEMFASLQDPAAQHKLHFPVEIQDPAARTLPTPTTLLEFARRVDVPDETHFAAPDDTDIRTLLDRDYLAHGGRVEFALDAVVEIAKDFSPRPFGDGTFDEERAEPDDPDREAWAALPTCKNDLAWNLVRESLDIGIRSSAHGPYFDM